MDASSDDTQPGRRLSARRWIGWNAAVFAAIALFVPAPAGAAVVPASTADSFVNSIGVNTHTYYTNTVYYSRFTEIKSKLAELGVRNIRENLMPNRSDQYQRLNELAAMGVKSTLILGDPRNGISGLDTLLSIAKSNLKGSVSALEGPNEFDISGQENWLPQLAAYQEHLFSAVKSDPALSSLPVIGPSLVHWKSQEELGDISGELDYGNIHSYPDGYYPESNLSSHLTHAATVSGSKPVMATETGYHTALNWTGSNMPVSEQAMATYVPRMFLEYFRRGVVKTFSYELVDEGTNSENREDNFGLLHNDLTPKPAFTALRNLIGILKDPGTSFTPSPLDYSLGGNQENLHQVLLQKSDGSFYLALWRATSVWDPVNRVALNPGSSPVTMSFNQPIEGVKRYVPNISSSAVESFSNPSQATVEVGPQVVILKVTPGVPTQTPTETESTTPPTEEATPAPTHGHSGKPVRTRIKAWVNRRSVRIGQRLTLHGRVAIASTPPHRIAIQTWARRWRTLTHHRVSKTGVFGTRIKLRPRRGERVARLRVVAPAVAPSRPILVRVTS